MAVLGVETDGRKSLLAEPGSRRSRIAFFAVAAAALVFVLWTFREVLTPFALALVVAYVLAPIVDRMCRLKLLGRQMPRWVAVVILYTMLVGSLAGVIAIGAPRLAVEVDRAGRELPGHLHTLEHDWIPQVDAVLRSVSGAAAPEPAAGTPENSVRIEPRETAGYDVRLPPQGIRVREEQHEYRITLEPESEGASLSHSIRAFLSDTQRYAGALLSSAQTLLTAIVGGIFKFFIMLMLSAYLLITSERIFAFFRSLARPDRRAAYDRLMARIDKGLSGVVRGQLVIALVNGALSAVGFWLADLRYWPVLTLFVTALSIIPIFGAWISSVPAILIALQDGIGTALFTLAWIVGIHQVEANVLNPKIMGDAAKVHPVLVVFALLAGESLYGIAGALLAVPILSIVQSIFLHFREIALGPDEAPPAEQTPEIEPVKSE